jgi:hypothetical protein
MTRFLRPALLSLLVAWLAVTALLTLSPDRYTPPLTLESFLCVACGWSGTADIIVNWMMFLPGGALMAMVFAGKRAVVLAVILTVVIETLQIGIPGRTPALQDLISNTLGAVSGVVLVRRGLGRRAQHVLTATAVVAWLSPVVLLIPTTSSSDLYGQWTPAFGSLEKYEGRVLAASVGGIAVRSGLLPTRAGLDAAIVERRPVALTLEVGPPPSTFAPVFQLVDAERVALLSVGARGQELVLRGENRARALGLHQPAIRWEEAMRGLPAGDTVMVTLDRSRSSACMSVGLRTACGLAPSLAEGWGHLISLDASPGWLRTLASVVWTISLGLVLGATCADIRLAAIGGTALGAAGLLASSLSSDVRPDATLAAVLAVSALLGGYLRSPLLRLWQTHLLPPSPRRYVEE